MMNMLLLSCCDLSMKVVGNVCASVSSETEWGVCVCVLPQTLQHVNTPQINWPLLSILVSLSETHSGLLDSSPSSSSSSCSVLCFHPLLSFSVLWTETKDDSSSSSLSSFCLFTWSLVCFHPQLLGFWFLRTKKQQFELFFKCKRC